MQPAPFARTLVLDVIAAGERFDADSSERHARELVRAVFAAIEGLTSHLKDQIAESVHDYAKLSIHERAALAEESYSLDERGTVRSQPRFLPLPSTIRLLVSLFQRFQPHYEVDFSRDGWAALRSSVEVRNRIVHPRSEMDLKISRREVSRAMAAFHWFLDLHLSMMTEHGVFLNETVRFLRELEKDDYAKLREAIANLPDDWEQFD